MRTMGAVVLAAALTGCSAGADVSEGPGAHSSLPPPPADLDRFYDQQLAWEPCDGAECATLEVPVDYAHPQGPKLQIGILRSPATGASRGALVVNPGGPGASGRDYARAARAIVTDPVRAAFDIVGFDPRGVGVSDPVDCMDDAAIDGLIALDATPDSPAEVRELQQAAGILNCSAMADGLPDHLSTADSARDMDVLRAALGQARLDYLGVSYGSHLGATYAALFPDRVGRFVLDGPLPSGLDAEAVALGQALGFENSLRRFVEYCMSARDCPLGSGEDVAAGLDRLRTLLDRLDASPALTADPERPLTEAAATYAILMSLYRVSDRPLLRDALSSLVAGDGTPLQRMLDERIGRQPDGSYRDNSLDAFYAITCRDRALPTDIPASVERLSTMAPFLGEYIAWGNLACSGVTAIAAPSPTRSAPDMLVIATTHDPATPIAWGEMLVDELGSAVLLVREGDGHTGYREGSRCVDEAVDDFLLDGRLPPANTVCE